VPAAANAEKGETLFSIFTDGAVKLIGEMRDWDGQSWDG
jgi:creatinine amidohydrolase/Fe(II)-dependent formamide hydrolase-like protein